MIAERSYRLDRPTSGSLVIGTALMLRLAASTASGLGPTPVLLFLVVGLVWFIAASLLQMAVRASSRRITNRWSCPLALAADREKTLGTRGLMDVNTFCRLFLSVLSRYHKCMSRFFQWSLKSWSL